MKLFPQTIYNHRLAIHLSISWLILGFCWLCVLIVLSITTKTIPTDVNIPEGDKVLHFLAYFFLMYWFGQIKTFKPALIYGFGLLCLGIVLELLQSLTTHRSASLLDMFANAAGVITALTLVGLGYNRLLIKLSRYAQWKNT